MVAQHPGGLAVQDGVVNGGEEAGLCHFVVKEPSRLQVVHHDRWKERELL